MVARSDFVRMSYCKALSTSRLADHPTEFHAATFHMQAAHVNAKSSRHVRPKPYFRAYQIDDSRHELQFSLLNGTLRILTALPAGTEVLSDATLSHAFHQRLSEGSWLDYLRHNGRFTFAVELLSLCTNNVTPAAAPYLLAIDGQVISPLYRLILSFLGEQGTCSIPCYAD